MTEFSDYKTLCNMVANLSAVNTASTERVNDIRKLNKKIKNIITDVACGSLTLTSSDVNNLQSEVDELLVNSEVNVETTITTTATIESFQLGASVSNVDIKFNENSVIPPERGIIIQKLWKIKFADDSVGYAIISDTSDADLSLAVNAQVSTTLANAPASAVEDLNVTITLDDIKNSSQDLSSLMTTLEKPGLVARQLRDIDIDNDPELQSLTVESTNELKAAIATLNAATTENDIKTAQTALQTAAENAGLYSTSIGPTANGNYSDLKRFLLQKDEKTTVSVTLSMPVISWGPDIAGIPLRDPEGAKVFSNRKDDGTSYIVDMGGIDPAIRNGTPNPLPATKFYNNGPAGATTTEGALDRYKGGKSLGINTTDSKVTIQTLHREADGVVSYDIPAKSAVWKLDRATFDGGNKHAYYTVFSASRPPPAGFMGVVFAPKQNRLGRGRGEVASGVTLANGVSKTGNTFNNQDANGAILVDGKEVPSGLKGVTCDFDGHGLDPKDFLTFLEANSFVKGTQYLTIPADATTETVEDVLIPAGQFIPQITQSVATLLQFGNGKYVQDGGPNRYQAGLIPFMPGTPAYTPEWHINFMFYNCGEVECEGNTYPITTAALTSDPSSWIRPNHNASFGPPGPNPANSEESKFSPAFPNTFDPVQLRCGIKGAKCLDYIDDIKGSKQHEITLSMLSSLEAKNKLFVTEAPPGALRGWVKFLVVNCPLPVVATIDAVIEQKTSQQIVAPETELKCTTCTCSREATNVFINGDLNPVWIEKDDDNKDSVIETRVLKFKVGDDVVIRSTSGTMHGVSLRFDDMKSNITFDTEKTLATIQSEVLTELKERVIINNEQELENNIIALDDTVIAFHGGIPITFSQKASVNPTANPNGVAIADFTIKEGTANKTGTVSCTVHGVSMSFRFTICPVE